MAGVVCSAGVGRTGVFVTLSIVLERMRYEGVVDMFQTVKILRTQRPAMVQNEVPSASYRVSFYRLHSRGDNTFASVRVCACVCVSLTVGTLMFERFDL